MTASIISGKGIATKLLEENLVPRVEALKAKGITPKLVVIFVGEDPASASYIRQKERFAKKCGMIAETWRYPESTTENEILETLEKVNQDDSIHGVIVQVPLPDHISVDKILSTIKPEKDVDGFTVNNIGELFLGQRTLECCTPRGIITMIKESGHQLSGTNVTVIGRSNHVGKAVAILALNENATVTICHSRTKDLKTHLAQAEIIIVAVGRPEFLHGDDIPEGAVVIDVGIHATENGLCGDVHFDSAVERASAISPVPGGVGPMTVYSLIENTIEAAELTSN